MKITFLILSILTMAAGFASMGTNENAGAALLVVAGLAGIGFFAYLRR